MFCFAKRHYVIEGSCNYISEYYVRKQKFSGSRIEKGKEKAIEKKHEEDRLIRKKIEKRRLDRLSEHKRYLDEVYEKEITRKESMA